MSSDAEDDAPFSPSVMSDSSTMQDAGCTPDAPKLHDSASTLAEGLHGDVQTSSATACRHEADEAVSMPLCSTPRLPRRICGHDLSIAELKAALGSACGRQVGGQDYSHSRPTASKPPVCIPHARTLLANSNFLLEAGCLLAAENFSQCPFYQSAMHRWSLVMINLARDADQCLMLVTGDSASDTFFLTHVGLLGCQHSCLATTIGLFGTVVWPFKGNLVCPVLEIL